VILCRLLGQDLQELGEINNREKLCGLCLKHHADLDSDGNEAVLIELNQETSFS
jgi:hypothetical protein